MLTRVNDFNNFDEVVKAFTSLGGQFILPPDKLKSKCANIKAFVFDWDGVFNNGFKTEGVPSPFSEIDAAGLNLLRYSFYRINKTIPVCSIISGEDNPGAKHFSKRENFNVLYLKTMDKARAIGHLCSKHNITPEQVACVFDDLNDLSMAKICGLRFLINRSANPMYQSFAVKNGLCDYITGNEQEKYPIREICELIMGISGTFEQSIQSRVELDDTYRRFLEQKKSAPLYLAKASGESFEVEVI